MINNGELVKDINYAIAVWDPSDQQIYLNSGEETTPYLGIKASEGIDTQTIYTLSEGIYVINLALTGTGFTNWENYIVGEARFEVGKAGESVGLPTTPNCGNFHTRLDQEQCRDGGQTDR